MRHKCKRSCGGAASPRTVTCFGTLTAAAIDVNTFAVLLTIINDWRGTCAGSHPHMQGIEKVVFHNRVADATRLPYETRQSGRNNTCPCAGPSVRRCLQQWGAQRVSKGRHINALKD